MKTNAATPISDVPWTKFQGLRKQRRQPGIVAVRPAIFDDQVAALAIAEIAQTVAERLRPLGQAASRRQAKIQRGEFWPIAIAPGRRVATS